MNDFNKFDKLNVYFKSETFKNYCYIRINIKTRGFSFNFIKLNIIKEFFNF